MRYFPETYTPKKLIFQLTQETRLKNIILLREVVNLEQEYLRKYAP